MNNWEVTLKCGICRNEFIYPYKGVRIPSAGEIWCNSCQDKFDGIDWDQINEDRRDG
jgi:hypothetical protein